ncbi:hypothetical protein [Kordiimonas lacus]|uniref:PAS domain-containing protein n=1 Tax=Kordiimonas lacus TaxID=637679 RepID=A0A1G6TW33_9PROT|nr:hypothetical protein [Kordiimonas lacus]SDD33293.1 hypothetical protein SAMN04488071_0381 [Kordiimonas lacus]
MQPRPRLKLSQAETEPRQFGTSHVFDLNEGLPALDRFNDIIALFDEKWDGKTLPQRLDYRFQDLRGWHSHFALTEMNSDLSDGSFRIMGSNFAQLFGGSITQGSRLRDARTERVGALISFFGRLLNTPAMGYFNGRLGYDGREHVNLEVLDIPATDRHGELRYILSFARGIRA